MFAVLLGQADKMLHAAENNLLLKQASKSVVSSFLTSDDISLDKDEVFALRQEFSDLADRVDDNSLILYHIAQLAYWSRDYERIIGSFGADLQKKQFPLGAFVLGSAYWEMNQTMGSKSSWRPVEDIMTYFLIQASQAEAERNYHLAEENFQKSLAIAPDSPEALSGYLFVHSINLLSDPNSDPSAKYDAISQALSHNNASFSRQLGLGAALYQARELKLAEKALKQAIRLEPRSHWPKYYLGLGYFAEEDYLRAEELLVETVQITPDFARGHHWLARTMVRLGNTESALIHYQLALSLLPHDNALVNEAEIFFERMKDTK